MKRLLILALAFMVAACGGDDAYTPDTPDIPDTETPGNGTGDSDENGDGGNENTTPDTSYIALDIQELTFPDAGGEAAVAVSASGAWTLDGNSDWAVPSAKSGNDGDTVTFAVQPNAETDDRSALFTFKCGTAFAVVQIVQKQKDALTVTKSRFELGKEGGTVEIEVRENIDFTFDIDEASRGWITHAGTRAMETSVLTFEVAPYGEPSPREGTVTLYSDSVSEVVRIYQTGVDPSLTVDRSRCEISVEGAGIAVGVEANVEVSLNIPDNGYWVVPNADRTGGGTWYFDIGENRELSKRETTVSFFNAASNLSATVTFVQQAGTETVFEIPELNYTIGSEGGEIVVNIVSNISYEGDPTAEWIHPKGIESKGVDKRNLFDIDPNPDTESRMGLVVFCNDDMICMPVFITQDGAAQ